MTIEELRTAIETYPQSLAAAMEIVTIAEQDIEKLEEQIDEEENQLLTELAEVSSSDNGEKQSG